MGTDKAAAEDKDKRVKINVGIYKKFFLIPNLNILWLNF
jgi:hypothetical protein